jgi:hypothetical protein
VKSLPRALAGLLHLGGGLLLWSSCFVVLYALLSLGCEAGWTHGLLPALWVAWAAHLAALGLLLAWQWKSRTSFAPLPELRAVALAATLVALVATAWIGWPTLALPPCAGHGLR